MDERFEEMGMSDMQFKSYLMELLDKLETIKEMGVSDEAAKEIDKMIARFKVTIES